MDYYGVFKTEYNVVEKEVSELMETFHTETAATNFLINYVKDFLEKKEGEDKANSNTIREPSYTGSRRWSAIEPGYFKTNNIDENLHKIKVWKKTINKGYIYNSNDIQKVFEIDIIKFDATKFAKYNDSDSDCESDYDGSEVIGEATTVEESFDNSVPYLDELKQKLSKRREQSAR